MINRSIKIKNKENGNEVSYINKRYYFEKF